MDVQKIYYPIKSYIITSQGNKVSTKAIAHGSQNISLNGNVRILFFLSSRKIKIFRPF